MDLKYLIFLVTKFDILHNFVFFFFRSWMFKKEKQITVLGRWPCNLCLNVSPTVVGGSVENLLYCYPVFPPHHVNATKMKR